MCLYPKLIRNPKYKANNKNGGNIPPVSDKRVVMVPIGCGNCIECLKQKQSHWKARLLEDIKVNTNGRFITLTFSNESIKNITNGLDINGNKVWLKKEKKYREPLIEKGYELDNKIATISIRDFLERWRKKFGKSIRHFFITELGHNGTENIHLHGVLWTDELPDTIRKIWQYGYIWPRYNTWDGNYVTSKTIGYIAKYITKRDFLHKHYKPVILTSAGIGANYINTHNAKLNKYKLENTKDNYTLPNGKCTGLPIYYRNKIYSEEEREKLWLEKLDKNERWVLGNKINIIDDFEKYLKILSDAQQTNIELGYGTDKNDWEQLQYENNIRIIKQLQRTKNKNR